MPSPVQHSASTLRSLHLLRALLREASYLPDAGARSYFRRYIVHRFRAYEPKHNAPAIGPRALQRHRDKTPKGRHANIIQERLPALHKKASKGVYYLRRANNGELKCLEKVMLFAYGRMGTRRYALLNKLLMPDPSPNEEPPDNRSPLQDAYYSNKRFLSFFDRPVKAPRNKVTIDFQKKYSRLKAVVKSQSNHRVAIGRPVRRDKLSAPATNVWERPMPIKRARNIVRTWYKATMSAIMPPLPDHEWDRLRNLALGKSKWKDFKQRRTPAVSYSAPANAQDQATKVVNEGLIVDKINFADRPRGLKTPSTLSPRLMRRLYLKVLCLSPKLEWNSTYNNWQVQWGRPNELTLHSYTKPVDAALFAGVDKKGKLPSVPKVPRPPRTEHKTPLAIE